MDINNLTNVYNNNPTLQGSYTLQQYLDLFGGSSTPPTPDPDPDPDPTPDPDPDPTPGSGQGIIGADMDRGNGIQSLQSTFSKDLSGDPRFNYLKPNEQANKYRFDRSVEPRDGLMGYVDKIGNKFKESKFFQPKIRGTLGNRLQKQSELGEKLPSFITKIASMQSPFNPSSGNYNPNMASQLNYLEGMDGTKISGTYKDPFNKSLGFTDDLTGQAMIGRDPNSGGLKYGPGTVLEGKNVISGFGSNDYETALEKYLEKMQGYKKKTTFQQKKIDRANKELEDFRKKEKERQQKEADDKAKQASGLTDRQNIEAIQNYTGRQISDYRASRPASERNYTGGGGQGNDNTGGGAGSKGASDSFSNKSGMGRTGYEDGGSTNGSGEKAFSAKVKELMDDGYEFGEAVKEAMKQGYANGGRIKGYFKGGLVSLRGR